MAYTALYRKYRPSKFEDVKGQDHIVTTLKNQINTERIGHAYLFCGTRGTGKTTVAKILAKAVNCEYPRDGSPCGECAVCRSISSGASMNVVEIDAASNNGVENIRQIREEVAYPPTEGRYRVYIIDEVHMLSTGAFNALLKTLEEPPEYVIFILATTEVHKIPVTILSRCQRYDFRRISIDIIAERLTDLLAREQVEAEEKAIRYVARAADGSMRDALSLMDQCIAFYPGELLTFDRVLEVLGATDTDVFSRLLRAVLAWDVAAAVQIAEDIIVQGREPGQFANDFVWYLRNLLLIKSSDHMEEVLDMSGENLALLKEEADMADEDAIMRYIRVFSELSEQMRFSSQKRVLLEIALIKLCRPSMETNSDALSERVAYLERRMECGVLPTADAASPKKDVPPPEKDVPPPEKDTALPEEDARLSGTDMTPSESERPDNAPGNAGGVVKKWDLVLRQLDRRILPFLRGSSPVPDGEDRIVLTVGDPMSYDYLKESRGEKQIADAIFGVFGLKTAVLIRKTGSDASPASKRPSIEDFVNAKLEEDED